MCYSKNNKKMTFLSFCSSIKQKFINFTSNIFKSKKVGDGKFNNSENNETRTENLLKNIMSRLEVIEKNLNKLIDEKNKEMKDSFEYNVNNNVNGKRYKVM